MRDRHWRIERRRRIAKLRRGVYILPSLLTTTNIFCGFLSIVLTFEQQFTKAALFIVLAGILGGLDGRIARLMGATTEFGGEYDSLADVVSFSLAPPFSSSCGASRRSSVRVDRRVPLSRLRSGSSRALQYPARGERPAVVRRSSDSHGRGRRRLDRSRLPRTDPRPGALRIFAALILCVAWSARVATRRWGVGAAASD
jgi:hypothetical protein